MAGAFSLARPLAAAARAIRAHHPPGLTIPHGAVLVVTTRRTMATAATAPRAQPSRLRSVLNGTSRVLGAVGSALYIPRVPVGYWERRWPELQMDVARVGTAGTLLASSLAAVKLSYEASSFLTIILPFTGGAPLFLGGAAAMGLTSGGLAAAHNTLSADPKEVREAAFRRVHASYVVERKVGGGMTLGNTLAFSVQPAYVVLGEARKGSYFRDYKFQPATIDVTFDVQGDSASAVVTCSAVRPLFGAYAITHLHVTVNGHSDPEHSLIAPPGEARPSPAALLTPGGVDAGAGPRISPVGDKLRMQVSNFW